MTRPGFDIGGELKEVLDASRIPLAAGQKVGRNSNG
jgi:hypothetical protein